MRKARNLSEKKRRERLDSFIKQLATLIPIQGYSNKRLDRKSILRLSAAHLRVHRSPLTETREVINWKPQILSDEYFSDLLATSNSFAIITSGEGKIMFVSKSCETFLGHSNIDMLGFEFKSFIHPSDTFLVENCLQESKKQLINKGVLISDRISFRCRMKEKSQPRTEINTYQYVNVSGVVKMYPDKSKPIQKLCVKRYGNNRRKESTLSSLRTLFCGVVQIIKPNPRDLSLLEANDNEYKTRLTLDGRLVDADHRISLITGHFPDEVRGNSAYDYIHEDDLPISLFAHKLMLSNSNGTGIIVHRLRTCSNSYVFLQSAGYLDYDKDTGTASHFVCVSKLLIDHEGMEERNKFVNKFTPHISNSSAKALYESLKVVVGPRCSDLTYERSNTSLTEKCTNESIDTIKTVVTGRVPLYNAHNPTEAMNAIDKIAQRLGVLQPQLPQAISSQTASSYTSDVPILAIVNTENNTENKVNHIPCYGALPLLRQFNNNCGGELLINPMSHLANSTSHPAYSINSMTQFNGVNQPLTGAIFFNFGETSVPQFTQNVNIPLINIKDTVDTTSQPVIFNNETFDDEINSTATSTPENNINMEPPESNSPAASPVDSSLLNDCESFYQMDESTFFDVLTNDSYDDEKCNKKQRSGLSEADAELLHDSMPSMFNDSEISDKYFSPLFFDDQNCLNTTFNTSNTATEYLTSNPVTDLMTENQI